MIVNSENDRDLVRCLGIILVRVPLDSARAEIVDYTSQCHFWEFESETGAEALVSVCISTEAGFILTKSVI